MMLASQVIDAGKLLFTVATNGRDLLITPNKPAHREYVNSLREPGMSAVDFVRSLHQRIRSSYTYATTAKEMA